MKKVYFHVGMPKTGTTTIQQSMDAARDALLSEGVIYPSGDHSDLLAGFHQVGSGHFIYNLLKRTEDEAREAFDTFLDAVWKQAKQPHETIVLSSEYFHSLRLDCIEKVDNYFRRRRYELRVIFYIRHSLAQATSSISQDIKQSQISLDEALQRPNWRKCRPSISPFLRYMPDRLDVRSFDEAVETGVMQDFMTAIGHPNIHIPMIRGNISLTMAGVYIADAMNKAQAKYPSFPKNRRFLQSIKGRKFCLPPDTARNVLKIGQDDVEWVKKNFGITLICPEIRDDPLGVDKDALLDMIRLMTR